MKTDNTLLERMLSDEKLGLALADMFVETIEGNIASLSKEDIMELLS